MKEALKRAKQWYFKALCYISVSTCVIKIHFRAPLTITASYADASNFARNRRWCKYSVLNIQ